MAAKRLNKVGTDKTIQGYHDGNFWERNSLADQKQAMKSKNEKIEITGLFDEQ